MDKVEIQDNWDELKGKLKHTYTDLTDDDLLLIEGKEEELLSKLQQKLGKTKGEVRDVIEKFASKVHLKNKTAI